MCWALLGVVANCQEREEQRASASAPPVTVPRVHAPSVASAVSPRYMPVPVPSTSTPKRAAFAVVTSPLKYFHERPRFGTPAAPAFTASSGLGGWGRGDRPWYNLVVDATGSVWRAKRNAYDQPPSEHQRLGHVGAAQFAEMRRLATRAVGKPVLRDNYCPDYGGHGYSAHGLRGAEGGRQYLGGTHSCDEHIDSKEGARVADWLSAIEERMLRVERPRPFGLQLPVVSELSDTVSQRSGADTLVFELTESTIGVVIDASGDVYRYFDDWKEPRALRRVGSVGHTNVQLQVRRAELAAREPAVDYEGARACTSVVFYAKSGERIVLGKDCPFGTRRQGRDADQVIAWLYAINEQAVDVDETGWPHR